jgi:hypothetical protein
MNNELEGMWQEAAVIKFELLSRHLPRGDWETPQSPRVLMWCIHAEIRTRNFPNTKQLSAHEVQTFVSRTSVQMGRMPRAVGHAPDLHVSLMLQILEPDTRVKVKLISCPITKANRKVFAPIFVSQNISVFE